MAQQRQQRLDDTAGVAGVPSDEYFREDEYDEFEDACWGATGGGCGGTGRKAGRSPVAVTPGRRPVSRHTGVGSSHDRRKDKKSHGS